MGLGELQAALARLYTDAAAREQCTSDPAAFAARFRLSEFEAASLAGSVLHEAYAFASALARKRFSEASRSMPLAAEILGSSFAPWFAAYAAVNPFAPGHAPGGDALDFHKWLLAERRSEFPSAEWDALRYEQGWLLMQHTRCRFLIRWLLIPSQNQGSRCLVLWWRSSGKLRYWSS